MVLDAEFQFRFFVYGAFYPTEFINTCTFRESEYFTDFKDVQREIWHFILVCTCLTSIPAHGERLELNMLTAFSVPAINKYLLVAYMFPRLHTWCKLLYNIITIKLSSPPET